MFSGSVDRTVCVWDMENWACLFVLEGHSKSVFVLKALDDWVCACLCLCLSVSVRVSVSVSLPVPVSVYVPVSACARADVHAHTYRCSPARTTGRSKCGGSRTWSSAATAPQTRAFCRLALLLPGLMASGGCVWRRMTCASSCVRCTSMVCEVGISRGGRRVLGGASKMTARKKARVPRGNRVHRLPTVGTRRGRVSSDGRRGRWARLRRCTR